MAEEPSVRYLQEETIILDQREAELGRVSSALWPPIGAS